MPAPKRGRPRTYQAPVVIARLDDQIASWRNGKFVGDEPLASTAAQYAAARITYEWNRGELATAPDTAVGAAAAFLLVGHRVIIEDAPDDVYEHLIDQHHGCCGVA